LDNDKFDKNKYQLALESENSSNEYEMLNTVVQQIIDLLEDLLADLIDIIREKDATSPITNVKESITNMTKKICDKGREILDLI